MPFCQIKPTLLQRASRATALLVLLSVPALAQMSLSKSAYRALGQPNLRMNGLNRVEGVEFLSPSGVAVDARDGFIRIFVADTGNHRVLGWADARSYQTGEIPAVVLGQPSRQQSNPLGIGHAGLNSPAGLAVDPNTGHLYVADTGNHRVLRFPNPFAMPSRIEPDAVYGQPDFQSRTPSTGGVHRSSLNGPLAVAVDAAGNLWVADSRNHRVLRFSAGVLDAPNPEADLVLGQTDMFSGSANRGGSAISGAGFQTPSGLAFDGEGNLYVSDFENARVLRFSPAFGPESTANRVFGQGSLTSRDIAAESSGRTLAGPMGLTVVDQKLYVSVPRENRVMVFSTAPGETTANNVLGQPDFTSTTANGNSRPRAAAYTLSGPRDVKSDASGNIYVADSGNHRVLSFPINARTASQVWGQFDFSGNGANQIKPGSINAPFKIAIDYSRPPYPVYVSDTNNHRVLIWKDAVRWRTGDSADLVIGQPDLRSGLPNVDSAAPGKPSRISLSAPRGIALDGDGNLYVADSGNNRVLRFSRPTEQIGRITSDAVLGQPDFTTSLSAAVTPSSLRQPSGVAVGGDGTVYVSDTGNNRVLEFLPLSGSSAAAIRVYGQAGFYSGIAHSAVSPQTLNSPVGIVVDASSNLYVADSGANRVVVFANTRDAEAVGAAAVIVIGSDRFDTVARSSAGPNRFQGPVDVALSSSGEIVVSDSGNNRVLVFPSLLFIPISDAAATTVIGQADMSGTAPNWNSRDGLATPEGLYAPLGLAVDRRNTVYVGDTGNNRVMHFLRASTAVHAANPQASLMPRGGLVSIQGQALADGENKSETPLPTVLQGREVVVNDEFRAPLLDVAPNNISIQLPSTAPTGSQRIAVRVAETAELIAGTAINISPYSPGLYSRVQNQDGTTNSASNPALKGSTIRLTGTGQGAVTPTVNDGEAAPEQVLTVAIPTSDGNTCLTLQPSVCVAMGNAFGDIQFSGLMPGRVGTWQLDVTIPIHAASGNVPMRAVIAGVPSNIISVAIR